MAIGGNGAVLAETADLLVQLPSQWQSELKPIPDSARGSGLDDASREKISLARWQVVQVLRQKTTTRQELARVYARLGAYYLHYSVYTLAEPSYANAAKLDPQDFRWIYYLAFIAQQTGRPELALKRYARARQLDSNFPPLDLHVADIQLDLNQLDTAQEAYERAAGTSEFTAPAEYGLGQIALLQRDYTAAITHFEKVLQLDPGAAQTHYPLAQAYRALKQNERARQHLSQHAKGKPEIDDPLIKTIKNLQQGAALHFKSAVTAVNQGQFDLALKEFAAGLEQDPQNAAAQVSYARVLYLAGKDKNRVRQELQQALSLDNSNTLALFLLGVLAAAEANDTQAVKYYQRVLQIDPDHAGAHFYLASQLFNHTDYAAACPHYNTTIELEPMNLNAQLKYLSCMENQGSSDTALYAQLETLHKRFPHYVLLSFLQVHLLALSSDTNVRDTNRAVVLARQLAEAQVILPHLEALALAYAANGDFQRAVEIQRELISAADSHMGNEQKQAEALLALYQSAKLPGLKKWFGQGLFTRQEPFDPSGPFRYYPAPRPY